MTPKAQLGQIGKGNYPGQQWQISQNPQEKGGFDTCSGWPEAFPCRTNKARKVSKVLLQKIIPRFGVPVVISSDRGSHFIVKIIQQVSKLLGIDWQLHTLYNPKSNGQVEKTNHLIKPQIVKLGQEADLSWPQSLLLALLRIRTKPRTKERQSAFEIMYGRPYIVQAGTSSQVGDEVLTGDIISSQKQL